MSKKLIPVTLKDFLDLVEYAQRIHSAKGEPIPQLQETHIHGVLSCLETPFQTFDGHYLYRGFYRKAAAMFYFFCKNHPLANGNKRMACLTLGYFCYLNRHELNIYPLELYDLAHQVTQSESILMSEVITRIAKVIRNNTD